MKKIVLATIAIMTSLAASAQMDGSTLDEVIVKENRIRVTQKEQNRNIRILTKEQIDALPIRSVTDILSYVAGIDLRQRGPGGVQADVSIDGGTFDQSLVLINGIKMTDPQTGHNMMNLPITLDVIDHVEILRGSAARIYGINALTGAINFVTKTPQKDGIIATGYAGSNFDKSASSDNKYNNWGARLTLAKVTAKTNQLFSGSHDLGNGYRYNTAYNNSKLFYQGKFFTKDKDYFDVLGGYTYNKYGANGFYAAPGDKNSGERVETGMASIGYHTNINPNWLMTPRLSYHFTEDDYRYIVNPLTARNLHKTHIFNLEWNNTIHTKNGDIGFGIEGRNEHIISSNLGNHNRYNYGLSGEYRFANLDKITLTAGAYLNYNTEYGWQLFPGIDAGYNFTKDLKWFANIGTGQRLPTYTDLYYKGPSNIGNSNLTPENARYVESGLKYNYKNLNATASYFYRRINHFIDWTKETITDPWQPNNFQRINTQGITFALDYKIKGTSNDLFSNTLLSVSYTYLNPKIKLDTSKAISLYAISSLRNQLVMAASSDIFQKLNISVTGRYLQRINYKDYFILDAKLSYRFLEKLHAYIDATNIGNITYIEAAAAPLPGKWFTAGLQLAL
ncbi:MAG: TonB-dependent receptor [Pseudopedobacter saltans]|uniref:TonB-dependent receptor n=1 Tax=Pseudopedobacter saltans TaxID=151895 RepID=A0A2W5F7L2_9SPHI|nr:MAG: TonB-dependent receptor [Pseudopedobacter saltans]